MNPSPLSYRSGCHIDKAPLLFTLDGMIEENQKILALTLALYRVTDFFPHTEALRRQIREKANDIFESIVECGQGESFARTAPKILGKIDTMKGYLRISAAMRFVRPINLTILEREYDSIADYFSRELEIERHRDHVEDDHNNDDLLKPPREKRIKDPAIHNQGSYRNDTSKNETTIAEPIEFDMNERQKMIMDHIRKTANARLSDFFSYFEGVSAKTIQRDLQELVESNKLKREGDRRWTIYSLNE